MKNKMKTLISITLKLELAKALKSAGFPQDTPFWWSNKADGHWRVEYRMYYKIDKRCDFSAPTAEELLEWFPSNSSTLSIIFKKWHDGSYYSEVAGKLAKDEYPVTGVIKFVDCVGKTLLYLAKNKLINFKG